MSNTFKFKYTEELERALILLEYYLYDHKNFSVEGSKAHRNRIVDILVQELVHFHENIGYTISYDSRNRIILYFGSMISQAGNNIENDEGVALEYGFFYTYVTNLGLIQVSPQWKEISRRSIDLDECHKLAEEILAGKI